jgi:Fe-S cluster biosynthesis and repair protein YggX
MSKAYQLGGEALIAMGDKEHAAEVLTNGYVCAAERGDLLPKNAMGELLETLGAPIPEVKEKAPEEASAGSFVCARTGKAGTQLATPPFKGPIGAWIQANISAQTWRDWIGQGTKVINELRLDLSREADQETYDRNMHEYLGIDDQLIEELREKAGQA